MAKRKILGREVDFPDTSKTWLHVKSGGRYVVLFPCVVEATLAPAVAYGKVGGDGLIWIRPVDEFMDGRFLAEE